MPILRRGVQQDSQAGAAILLLLLPAIVIKVADVADAFLLILITDVSMFAYL